VLCKGLKGFRPSPIHRYQPPKFSAIGIFSLLSSAVGSSSSGPRPMPAKDFVEKTISDHKVVVFSKSWCPYCRKAKALLASKQIPSEEYKVLELDEMDDGSVIQAYLQQKTSQRTVPNIFINQKHIGGSDDLTMIESSGDLAKLLTQ